MDCGLCGRDRRHEASAYTIEMCGILCSRDMVTFANHVGLLCFLTNSQCAEVTGWLLSTTTSTDTIKGHRACPAHYTGTKVLSPRILFSSF